MPEAALLEPLHRARSDALRWAVGLVGALSLVLLAILWRLLRPLAQLEQRAQHLFDTAQALHEGWPEPGGEIGRLSRVLVPTWHAYPLLKNFSKSDFDYLVRKVPAEPVMHHASNDEAFTNELIKKIKREGITVKASPRIVSNLIKGLFFMGLHRDDLGEDAYQETMNVMIDLVAGYIVGE